MGSTTSPQWGPFFVLITLWKESWVQVKLSLVLRVEGRSLVLQNNNNKDAYAKFWPSWASLLVSRFYTKNK